MPNTILPQQITTLLNQAAHAHHQAYLQTDGADPEWPLWYAQYLQAPLNQLLNQSFTQSELVYHFVRLDKAYLSKARMQTWQEFYADELVEEYGG